MTMGLLTTIKDRFLYGIGNEEAAGRLMHAAAVNDIRKRWKRFLGLHNIRQPSLQHFLKFIATQYGLELSEADEVRIFGREASRLSFDFERWAPSFATLLINQGIIDVELAA
jgi:hypothetical protein